MSTTPCKVLLMFCCGCCCGEEEKKQSKEACLDLINSAPRGLLSRRRDQLKTPSDGKSTTMSKNPSHCSSDA